MAWNEVVTHHLHRAQLRMKKQADKNRSERQFNEGDLVYLKLQPYIQTSVVACNNQKLSFRYFGPYKILAWVDLVSYRLQLPSDARIHPVVHVSQLKPHIAPTVEVSTNLSELEIDPEQMVSPIAFKDSRLIHRDALIISQVQVQWSPAPRSLCTWEEINDMKRHFPKAPAWGQAGFRGGGNVTYRKKMRKVGEL